jgi:hypothetical protein
VALTSPGWITDASVKLRFEAYTYRPSVLTWTSAALTFVVKVVLLTSYIGRLRRVSQNGT